MSLENKKCKTCKSLKPLEQFNKTGYKQTRRGTCAECHNAYSRTQYALNPLPHRERNLIRRYGITAIQYSSMLTAQGNKCAICKTSNIKLKKALCIDHQHSTGKIRGLLCIACNHALGLFKDNITVLHRAAEYLQKVG